MTVLSIIIPNFNSGNLLEESLNSIFKVPVSFSFEVLIMDNCSSDHPEMIVQKFPFENLYIFSEPDSGIYDAMNKGILKSQGEWLFFLGSGDKFFIDNFSNQVFKKELDLVYGVVFDKSKEIKVGYQMNLFDLLRSGICHQSILYRRNIFDFLGFFNLEFKVLADYHFNLRCFFSDKIRIGFLPILFSEYLGGGISSRIRDVDFNNKKLSMVFLLLLRNFSLNNLFFSFKYFNFYFLNKIKYELNI